MVAEVAEERGVGGGEVGPEVGDVGREVGRLRRVERVARVRKEVVGRREERVGVVARGGLGAVGVVRADARELEVDAEARAERREVRARRRAEEVADLCPGTPFNFAST